LVGFVYNGIIQQLFAAKIFISRLTVTWQKTTKPINICIDVFSASREATIT